jgi:hypothetical protein
MQMKDQWRKVKIGRNSESKKEEKIEPTKGLTECGFP